MKERKFCCFYIVFFLLFWGGGTPANAQGFSETMASEHGVEFTEPPGFKLFKNKEPYLQYFYVNRTGRRLPFLPDFYLDNDDASVRILVGTFGVNKRKPGLFNPYYVDGNITAFNHTFYQADTALYPIVYYPAEDLRYANADFISDFSYYFGTENTLGEYKYNRCLVFNKHNQVFLQVIYLFTESSKSEMGKVLRETKDMFRFKDRPHLSPPAVEEVFDIHYARFDGDAAVDTLPSLWQRGKIYHNAYYFWGESSAFELGPSVVSVQFPKNPLWPYVNRTRQERMDTTENRERWALANADFRKYLSLSPKSAYICTPGETAALGADEAYLFPFSRDERDLYRDRYRDCFVLLMHKRNVGSMIVKYYYEAKDKQATALLIKDTWGWISFKDEGFFDELGDQVFPY